MKTALLKLLAVPFVGGGAQSAARCDFPSHRTVLQFVRNVANMNPQGSQSSRKARHKEPLRRVKNKENQSKRMDLLGPSTVYLQVVGAGSRDNPASLYMFSENNR